MDSKQKEFYILSIRSGMFLEGSVKILPYKLETLIESHHVYTAAYDEALEDGLMTYADIQGYMKDNGLWTQDDEDQLKHYKNKIDDKKLKMYNARTKKPFLEKERRALRILEALYVQHASKEAALHYQSCEAIADTSRLEFLLRKHCLYKNKPISSELDSNVLIRAYNKSQYSDTIIRELARTEPWRSLWVSSRKVNFKLLFNKDDEDININQRSLILWSNTYDNIQEAYEPPSEDVIEDDDLLDGWFIYSRRKREREQKKKDLEDKMSSTKSKDADETFVMVNKEEVFSRENINSMNDPEAMITKQRRYEQLMKEKEVSYTKLVDVQDRGHSEAMEAMRKRSGGK